MLVLFATLVHTPLFSHCVTLILIEMSIWRLAPNWRLTKCYSSGALFQGWNKQSFLVATEWSRVCMETGNYVGWKYIHSTYKQTNTLVGSARGIKVCKTYNLMYIWCKCCWKNDSFTHCKFLEHSWIFRNYKFNLFNTKLLYIFDKQYQTLFQLYLIVYTAFK